MKKALFAIVVLFLLSCKKDVHRLIVLKCNSGYRLNGNDTIPLTPDEVKEAFKEINSPWYEYSTIYRCTDVGKDTLYY